jgi:hypothetical protein
VNAVWRIHRAQPDHGTHAWAELTVADRSATFEEVVRAWQSDEAFRDFWIASLRGNPFEAYCWECPPVSEQDRSRPFECVFVSSPSLAQMAPEPEVFAEHFRAKQGVVTFGNLGGDALLVVPCPAGPGGGYGHLAEFVRSAPMDQQHALWRLVGEAMEARLNTDPTWLSTAGHGVAWLHVRLDSSPKYYRHAEYRRA